MAIRVLIPLLLCGLLTAHGQSYRTLVARADSLYEAKDFDQSLTVYEEAFTFEKKNPSDLYNAACAAALARKKDRAYELLESAVDNGWINVRHLKQDSDLSSLHGEERWQALVDRMQKRLEEIESTYDKPMQGQLLQILEDDQKYRLMIDSVIATYGNDSPQMRDLVGIITEKDSINLLKVRAILDNEGWVGPDRVGGWASQALFLVIQHADRATQEHYLPMMSEAVSNGRASAADLALLVDRIEMRNGRPQIYGSQITMKDGTYVIYEIRDEANVNKRRADVGLQPLEEYVKRWNIHYTPVGK